METFLSTCFATGVAVLAAPVVFAASSAVTLAWPVIPLALALGAASHAMRGDT